MTQEVDWDRLDKKKFFGTGVALFSGVTTLLFPLSVIKTRQMAAHQDATAAGLSGTKVIAKQIWRQHGLRGFYAGFGTVVVGTIPARSLYMGSLEVTKSATTKLGERLQLSPTATAGLASAAGGAAASLSTQAVVVPVDVVSQRLMMQGAELGGSSSSSSSGGPAVAGSQSSTPAAGTHAASSTRAYSSSSSTSSGSRQQHHHSSSSSHSRFAGGRPASGIIASSSSSSSSHAAARPRPAVPGWPGARCAFGTASPAQRMSGLQMAQLILAQEGVAGLYRGFWPSVATFVPNSAIWWGAYGFWQRLLCEHLPLQQPSSSSSNGGGGGGVSTSSAVAVETIAAVLSGCTSSLLTNPLDLVKTRLQVAEPDAAGATPGFRQVLRELLAEEGPRGLLRGLAPRMASSVCWGTCMVSAYNFLKRISAADLAEQ